MFVCHAGNQSKQSITFLTRYRSGGTPLHQPGRVPEFCGPLPEGPGPTSSSGSLPALRVARRCSPVSFGRQHILARPVGPSTTSASTSDAAMENRPVTYDELPVEHKAKYDEIRELFEADLIGSFERTHTHGIKWRGFSPEGALDEVDLSVPSEERTRALRQEVNYMVAHSLHRHAESLVNAFERIAVRVVQEIMKHQYSPSGPALGTHQGEGELQTRPRLPFTCAAPEPQGSSAYVVYKIGGNPNDCQFLYEPPKEIPHGYMCTYVPDCNNPARADQGAAGGSSDVDADKQAWLAKYATGTRRENSTPANHTMEQISTILRDQFGILPKKKAIGYSKPYPHEYDLIPLLPKYRLPEFTKFNGSEGASSVEHVSRYLAQLGVASASDPLCVRFFAQSLTGPAFGWYTSLPPDSIRTWKQLEEQFHVQYHSEATEAGIADLAQVRQKRGETVSEYIQRFRAVKNRCYSARLTEREAVELAALGLAAPIKDLAFQVEYNSLAHMAQKLALYEQRHPELYHDKFKRPIGLVDTEGDEASPEDQEVAVAEWVRSAGPVSCKWVKPQGPTRGFDFVISKTEQIFDLLLKEKQLKLPEGHQVPTIQQKNGRPYCKWHHTFTHNTNDCMELHRQIQVAIEQGRLILGQFAMKVDTQPFPSVNMVERNHSVRRQLELPYEVNMAGPEYHHDRDEGESSHRRGKEKEEADPRDRLRYDDRRYLTREQVRGVRYQRPLSMHLLNKYEWQYDRRRRHDVEDKRYRRSDTGDRRYYRHARADEGYEHRAKETSREQEDMAKHWDCPFFKHCWDSGMSRLPTIGNCPACRPQKKDIGETSVFKRLGPHPPRNRQTETHSGTEDKEEDRYHRPRWCPDGLSHSQKRRVQRLRSLEEAEAQYLRTLRKARPDLAVKIQQTLEVEMRPQKKEWRPKQVKADAKASAGTNMVFILPSEFCAPRMEEAPVAQFDCGPRPVIFEKPREKSYKHLKALYLRGYINGQPVGKMLVDTGAAVNIMPYSMLRRLGHSNTDLIKTNVTLSDFNDQASGMQGVLNVDLTIGRKTIPTSFFIVDSKSTYSVLLGRDWIHANCCIPSTMHQCFIQWDGDEVEVVQADDSVEVSIAGTNIWDAADQEPISGISLDGCERIEASKNGVRLVLSTGLTE